MVRRSSVLGKQTERPNLSVDTHIQPVFSGGTNPALESGLVSLFRQGFRVAAFLGRPLKKT
jgi:hypothetical protein